MPNQNTANQKKVLAITLPLPEDILERIREGWNAKIAVFTNPTVPIDEEVGVIQDPSLSPEEAIKALQQAIREVEKGQGVGATKTGRR